MAPLLKAGGRRAGLDLSVDADRLFLVKRDFFTQRS